MAWIGTGIFFKKSGNHELLEHTVWGRRGGLKDRGFAELRWLLRLGGVPPQSRSGCSVKDS